MKNKIKFYKYDTEHNVTIIGKQSKYGVFFGTSEADPEDQDIANQWTGGRLAEYKCDMQELKVKAKYMRERAKGIAYAIQAVSQDPRVHGEEYWELMHKFEYQYKVAKREADELKRQYDNMAKNYQLYADREVQLKRNVRKKSAE